MSYLSFSLVTKFPSQYVRFILGAEYKVKFKSNEVISQSKMHLLSEVFTFVDMVPLFRELANKTMGSMLDVQKEQLFEMLSPHLASFEEALSSNESVTEWDDAEIALRTALYHLRHLSQSWTHVLSRDVYHLAIGELTSSKESDFDFIVSYFTIVFTFR